MISYFKYSITLFLIVFFGVSCLKHDLPSLPSYSDADITDIYSKYNYYDSSGSVNGNYIVRFQDLIISNKQFSNGSATATVTVPPASSFVVPAAWNNVSASNITIMCNLSTAATIVAVDGAPALGFPGDYSKPQKYNVTAADGKTQKTWTISVTFVK